MSKTLETSIPKLIRQKELAERLSLSRTTLWRAVEEGRFPQPTVRMGTHAVMWKEDDVNRWIESGGSP